MQPVFVTEYLSKFRLEFLVKILFHKSVILFKCYQEGEVNEESLLGSYRVEMARDWCQYIFRVCCWVQITFLGKQKKKEEFVKVARQSK